MSAENEAVIFMSVMGFHLIIHMIYTLCRIGLDGSVFAGRL